MYTKNQYMLWTTEFSKQISWTLVIKLSEKKLRIYYKQGSMSICNKTLKSILNLLKHADFHNRFPRIFYK